MNKWITNRNIPGVVAAIAAFCVYLATLAPSIGFIDSGELAAVAHTFGVAHPTGYPLFTLIAGVFSHLPLGGAVIWKLNLLAAICCASAVFFLYRVFLRLLTTIPGSARVHQFAAGVGVLVLAFSRTFWSQAVGVEVYSLHLLLVSLILFFFLRALPKETFKSPVKGSSADPTPNRQRWWVFAFVLGLGFSNHMTTLLLLPGLIYLYFSAHGAGRKAWLNAVWALPFFVLGLLPYLYIPLRAATHPAMNWGAIVDFDSFLWHISGKQYSGWMFSSMESAGKQFSLFADTLGTEFWYLGLIPALAGLGVLFRTSRRLFVFVTLLFVGCLLYAINYDIADIVNYFLLAYLSIALAASFGILAFLLFVARSNRKATTIAGGVLGTACFVVPLVLHYSTVNERGNYATEDYARNILSSAAPGAVILTTQWDHFIAAAYYLQQVEQVRPDVILIDRELLRRSWYHRYLSQRYPWLVQAARPEIEAFLPELAKFEKKLPYDPAVIQGTFENMVRSLLVNSLKTRPTYITPEMEPANFTGFNQIPSGALMRLYVGEPPAVLPQDFTFRPFPKNGPYFDILKNYYARAFANQGLLLGMRGDFSGSAYFLRRALVVEPGFQQAAVWLQQVEQADQAQRAASEAAPAR